MMSSPTTDPPKPRQNPLHATIANECIHGMTAEWCSICKEKERKKVASITPPSPTSPAAGSTFGMSLSLPSLPSTPASWEKPCPWCSNDIAIGELIFLIEEDDCKTWVCEPCAREWADES